MLKYKFFAITISLVLCLSLNTFAQRCGTVEKDLRLKSTRQLKQTDRDFEEWMRKKQSDMSAGRKKAGPYRIPVVFHIIHNGEPVGQGLNLSDQQIYSQLRVLNEDFQRRNADATETPDEFQDVAGSMDIQFVMARRDPNGNFTTGINRIHAQKTDYYSFEEWEVKSLGYWPAEDYLNIWVFNLLDFLGMAQYPVSDLPGMEGSPDIRETDGLMVSYEAFGSNDDGDFDLDARFDKGRTVPHEIGHFFGLRHIWGDLANCDGTDYVDDTPNQDWSTSGCPKHPSHSCSPSEVRMFQNFMDYTNDACMNLFTKQQVERMEIVINNSPRRKSLLTSPALSFPGPVPNDLGLLQNEPVVQCTNAVQPSIWIKNTGTNTITSANIRLTKDDQIIETRNFDLSLAPQDSTLVSFTTLSAAEGVSTIRFDIIFTNNTLDNNFTNDASQLTIVIDDTEEFIPMRQNFEEPGEPWIAVNAAGRMNWDSVETNFGQSLYFNAYNNYIIGDESWFVSPTLDFSNLSEASMVFDLSYVSREGVVDSLKIMASDDCGVTYHKMNYVLPVVKDTAGGWLPDDYFDWSIDQHIDLSAYAGQDDVRVAFVAKNSSGNNLYIDNIEFYNVSDPRDTPIKPQWSIFGYNGSDFSTGNLKIGFALYHRQNVRCEIANSIGQTIRVIEWHDVLNQIFDLPLTDDMTAGPYVVRVVIDGAYHGKLLFKAN